MALVGVVAIVVSHFTGFGEGQIREILSVVIAYILGQGVADNGKAAALINAKKSE